MTNYDWMKFYEDAVLETDSQALPTRIQAAQRAIGQRVMKAQIDETERRAMVRTLNALTALGRERCAIKYLICAHCKDVNDAVSALNGRTFLARIASGEIVLSLHTRCVNDWAVGNNCVALAPLKKSPVRISVGRISSRERHIA
jgi:hypothetical protein